MFTSLTQLKKFLPVLAIILVVFIVPNIVFADSPSFIQKTFYGIVNVFFGTLVGWGGMLLDYAVTDWVIGFGDKYNTTGLGFSIDTLWTTVRDIFNLTFIFGLVFIGFKMIFNSNDSSAKRMLGSLVLAALLVNFSLFITKFVVDFSNIAAMQLAGGFLNSAGKYEISQGFMNLLGLNNVWQVGTKLDTLSGDNAWGYIFGSLILYLVAAFVFLAGGLLLMVRFLVLNIYMVLSPLMFLGMVFPGFSSVSRDYWKGFLGRAFFAPAYILMLYFSYQILVNLKGVAGAGGFADLLSGTAAQKQAAAATTLPYFVMTAGFLIASLIVAQKMGAQGATSALAIGKRVSGGARTWTQRKVGGATLGTVAATGRNTIGRGANKIANSPTLNRWASKSSVAGAAMVSTRKVADSSFDARNVGGFGKAAGIGEGAKGGFSSAIKVKQKTDLEYAKSLSENKIEKDFNGNIIDPEIKQAVSEDVTKQKGDVSTEYGFKTEQNTKAQTEKVRANKLAAEAVENSKDPKSEEEEIKMQKEIAALEDEKKKQIFQPAIDKLEAEINTKKQSLATKQKETTARQAGAQALVKAAKEADNAAVKAEKAEKEALKAAKDSAESKIVYANQLAFIARREKDSTGKATKWAMGSAASGALAGALVAGPVGAAIGGGAGLVSGWFKGGAIGKQNAESVNELRKNYGTDGTVKKNSSKKEKELKILSEQLKDVNSGDAKVVTEEEK